MENKTIINIENCTINSSATDLDREIIKFEHFIFRSLLGYALFKYVFPIIVIVGIFGNIMSFVVFSTKTMNGSVSSIFFRVLAMADILVLCLLSPLWCTILLFHQEPQNLNFIACRIYPFLIHWTKDMPGWILSAVAVERAIGVSIPHRYKIIVTRKRAYFLLTITILTLFGINSFPLFTFRFISENKNSPFLYCDLPRFHKNIWDHLNMVVYCICPFTIICSSNICVIYFIVQASYRRRTSVSTNQSTNKPTNPSVILILVSVVYLCFTLPIMVFFVIIHSFGDVHGISHQTEIHLSLFYSCGILLVTLNSAINFFIYCLSGPRFRHELKNILFKPCVKAPTI